MIATSDVMCISCRQLRLVMAWTELAGRRLVTSVMVMPIIFKHRVPRAIRMMVMRQNTIFACVELSILKKMARAGSFRSLPTDLRRRLCRVACHLTSVQLPAAGRHRVPLPCGRVTMMSRSPCDIAAAALMMYIAYMPVHPSSILSVGSVSADARGPSWLHFSSCRPLTSSMSISSSVVGKPPPFRAMPFGLRSATGLPGGAPHAVAVTV